MKRLHLFELSEAEWFPPGLRDAATDYLQFVIAKTKPYGPVVPVLAKALEQCRAMEVLDLCSGAGGPWFWLRPLLAERGLNVAVRLTDKYPNQGAAEWSGRSQSKEIVFHSRPVDATEVPEELTGFRTIFSAFHHFEPQEARSLLADAMGKRHGIAVFEASQRSAGAMLVTLLVPLLVLLMTPFIRPFRWSRLFWTYCLPVVPLVTLFDGLVSSLRIYSVGELRELVVGLDNENYRWEIGELKSSVAPIPVTYLVGLPGNSSR